MLPILVNRLLVFALSYVFSPQVNFRHNDDDGQERNSCTIGIETNCVIRKGAQILVDYGKTFWRYSEELDEDDPPDVPFFLSPAMIRFRLHRSVFFL